MRLNEIQDKTKATRIPKRIFGELWAFEVDTVDDDSPEEKHVLADQMQRAEQAGNLFKVPLTNETQHYILNKSLPTLIDIARDNMDKRLVNSLQKFQARLHAKLTGS